MEQTLYKIGEIAARLGLADKNNNTLRSWTEEFGAFLSALANPPSGQLRRYTEHDLQVLTAVRDYRAHHLSYEEIRERLGTGAHTVTQTASGAAPAPHHAETLAPTAQGQALALAQFETLLAPLAASVDEWRRLAEEYRTRLETREARIDLLERRIDDLYTRLDATNGDIALDAHERAGQNGADPARYPTPADSSPDAESANRLQPVSFDMRPQSQADQFDQPSAGKSGIIQEDAPPAIFPLPVVVGTPEDAAARAVQPADTPRRVWWRLWRT